MATSTGDRISALPEDILYHILSFLPLKSAAQSSVLSNRWKTLWTYTPDRISALPEGLLHHILSFLPLKSAAQTSVLSNRWKTLWTYTPVLDFGPDARLPDSRKPYISIIKRCLNLHKSKTLQKFQFNFFPGRKFSSLLDEWIRFAAKKGVKELDLEFYSDDSDESEEDEEDEEEEERVDEDVYGFIFRKNEIAYGLPLSLFQSQSLVTLKLQRCDLNPPIKGFTGLNYLRTLDLVQVNVRDNGLSRIVSNCRFLEILCIWCCHELANLKVCGADLRLKKLLLLGCPGLYTVEIYAPNLELFEYDGSNFPKLDLKNVASLREVGLFFEEPGFRQVHSDFSKFLADVSHVQVLNVGNWFLQFVFLEYFAIGCRPMVFLNLKELHFYGTSLTRCPFLALVGFLSGCPSLTEVDLNLKYDCLRLPSGCLVEFVDEYYEPPSPFVEEKAFEVDEEDYWAAEGEQNFEGLDYQLHFLEIFKLKGFTGQECEMLVLKFILQRAVVLKSLVIKTEKECDMKEKQILQRQIAEFPVASSCGRVDISESSMSNFRTRHLKMFKRFSL